MNVTVIGAGNSGLAMAGHLALLGNNVRLWNRSYERIAPLMENKIIRVKGVIEGDAVLSKVTTDLDEAVNGVELIMITTPANAHAEIASKLAPLANQNMVIILNPGRTLGAWAFYLALQSNGNKRCYNIAETQTIIYTCRSISENIVHIIALKNNVQISGIDKSATDFIINKIPYQIRNHFVKAESLYHTSLGNVGMMLHCFPMLANVGWIETEKVSFLYYYDGITPSIANVIEKLDSERLAVAKKIGIKLPSLLEWFSVVYGVYATNIYNAIQQTIAYKTIDAPKSLHHRYILEDVPYGLVPLEKIGIEVNIGTPITTQIIDLANVLLQKEFRCKCEYVKSFLKYCKI